MNLFKHTLLTIVGSFITIPVVVTGTFWDSLAIDAPQYHLYNIDVDIVVIEGNIFNTSSDHVIHESTLQSETPHTFERDVDSLETYLAPQQDNTINDVYHYMAYLVHGDYPVGYGYLTGRVRWRFTTEPTAWIITTYVSHQLWYH